MSIGGKGERAVTDTSEALIRLLRYLGIEAAERGTFVQRI